MSEVRTKEIKLGDGIDVIIKQPSANIAERADTVYASKMAQLIRENRTNKLLLRTEAEKYMKDSGLWTSDDENTLRRYQREINEGLTKLRRGGDKKSNGRKIAVDVLNRREDIIKLTSKRKSIEGATIESFAEAERTDFLIFSCTVLKSDGETYWESFEDFKNAKLSKDYNLAAAAYYEVVFGVSNDYERNLPEMKWLSKYNFIDENLNFVDPKTKTPVDRDGNALQKTPLEEDIETFLNFANVGNEFKEDQPFIDDDEVADNKSA